MDASDPTTPRESETDPASAEDDVVTLHLASWGDRFVAWLVDVIIVGAILSAIGEVSGIFSLVTGAFVVTTPFLGVNGLVFWAYWTFLEGSRGQSAGKMVMNIAVRDARGDAIDYPTAAIQAFGKAFLLPIDCLVGWLFMSDEYVRLFNRLSDTIVVDNVETATPPEGVEYVRPE